MVRVNQDRKQPGSDSVLINNTLQKHYNTTVHYNNTTKDVRLNLLSEQNKWGKKPCYLFSENKQMFLIYKFCFAYKSQFLDKNILYCPQIEILLC